MIVPTNIIRALYPPQATPAVRASHRYHDPCCIVLSLDSWIVDGCSKGASSAWVILSFCTNGHQFGLQNLRWMAFTGFETGSVVRLACLQKLRVYL